MIDCYTVKDCPARIIDDYECQSCTMQQKYNTASFTLKAQLKAFWRLYKKPQRTIDEIEEMKEIFLNLLKADAHEFDDEFGKFAYFYFDVLDNTQRAEQSRRLVNMGSVQSIEFNHNLVLDPNYEIITHNVNQGIRNYADF